MRVFGNGFVAVGRMTEFRHILKKTLIFPVSDGNSHETSELDSIRQGPPNVPRETGLRFLLQGRTQRS